MTHLRLQNTSWRTGKDHLDLWHRCFRLLPLSLLFLALVPSFARGDPQGVAQETPSQIIHQFNLEEIIQRGLEVSPQLWKQRHVIEQAEAQLKQARSGRLPRMEYLQIAGPVNQARGDVSSSPDDRSDLLNNLGPFTRLELTVSQPLYTFGRLKAHIAAANKGVEAKQASLERFKLELIVTLKELFYTSLLNEDLFRLLSDTEKQFTKAVEKAEELLEEDEITQQDLLRLRHGLYRSSGEMLALKKGRRLVHAALLRLLYLPEGEDFTITDKHLKPRRIDLKPLETYKETAKKGRPEWRQLEVGIEAKEAELKAEQRAYFPDIFATGIFRYAVAPNRDKQENPFAVEDFNYLDGGLFLGLRLALDFGLPARIAEKRAEVFALQQEHRDATSGMLLEVERAYHEAVEKEQMLRIVRKERKNGRALATLSAASFQLGLGDAQETFEAFATYAQAAARYYLAIKDYNMATAELARVTGLESLE